LAARALKGLPTPAWDRRPVLAEELEWVLEGFWVLSQARPGGWGLAPIGVPAIKAYLDLIQCHSAQDRLVFLEFVLALDREFLRWSSEHGERPRSDADAQS
jgi:hypothetical protein